MQGNILKDSSINKIYLIYTEKMFRKKFQVKLRYMDKAECFFAADLPPKFEKPKKKTPVEIQVYTKEGVYKTSLLILDSNISLREVLFQVNIPETWRFIQLRDGSRVSIDLPITIEFEDGFKINTTTYDVSTKGVSFFWRNNISSIYKKLTGKLTIQFPDGVSEFWQGGKMVKQTKYIREKEDADYHIGETLYVYKFMDMTSLEMDDIKSFLLSLSEQI